jgi:hypothetical protein
MSRKCGVSHSLFNGRALAVTAAPVQASSQEAIHTNSLLNGLPIQPLNLLCGGILNWYQALGGEAQFFKIYGDFS